MQEVKAQEEVELLPEDTKVLSQDQVIQEKLDLRGGKCHFKEEFLNLDFVLQTELKLNQLILILF